MPGALSHLTVLDLSRVLAGPWCTQFLADLGACVIKIEKPGSGDDTRAWGPPWLKRRGRRRHARGRVLPCVQPRQAHRVAVDFTQPEGQAIVRELAVQADIVVENFRVGGLAKYGLDYANLSAINPRLVYCSITGFGQTGPYADRAGYDFIIQGMGGFMSVTGERDDLPGGGPQKVGDRDRRPDDRDVRVVGDPRRDRPARRQRPGPVHRHGRCSTPGGDDGQ